MKSRSPLTLSRRIIGLTGGIATGKSTVSEYLAQAHQCPIHDADLLARAAVSPPSIILSQIVERYGSDLLTPRGTLNRPRLGQIIFHNSQEKQWVESLIHPYVYQRLVKQIETFHSALDQGQRASTVICLAIPLLFEAQMDSLASEIWVVTCSPDQQLARLRERNHLSETEALQRIQNQWPLANKVKRADIILNNDGDRPQLFAQIDAAMNTPPSSHRHMTL